MEVLASLVSGILSVVYGLVVIVGTFSLGMLAARFLMSLIFYRVLHERNGWSFKYMVFKPFIDIWQDYNAGKLFSK